jgi:hypothetical protein
MVAAVSEAELIDINGSEPHGRYRSGQGMATFERQPRSTRRHHRWVERWQRDAEYLTLHQRLEARLRYQHKHPWSGPLKPLLWMHGLLAGIQLGGRPKARRCTKRLGTRYCWNWQVLGTDRCARHGRRPRGLAPGCEASGGRSDD